MKVNELRTKLKEYKKDELQMLVVEMYKQFPKKIREDKEIDELIADRRFSKSRKKAPNKKHCSRILMK